MIDTTRTDSPASPAPVRCQLNGVPVSADDLRMPALFNYGHFTSMSVREGCVRGLDLHLARLERATLELFGTDLDAEAVRDDLRAAIGGDMSPLSARINVFSRQIDRERMARAAPADVLVTITAAREADTGAIRLKTYAHERTLPHIKHVGTFELFHHRRLAQMAGYDDALFVNRLGDVSEASIWNIGFFDGERIVWPDAPMLRGISMQLVQRGLDARGIASGSARVARVDIPDYRSAFLTNASCPVRSVASIDGVDLAVDPELGALLLACYESNPWQPV